MTISNDPDTLDAWIQRQSLENPEEDFCSCVICCCPEEVDTWWRENPLKEGAEKEFVFIRELYGWGNKTLKETTREWFDHSGETVLPKSIYCVWASDLMERHNEERKL